MMRANYTPSALGGAAPEPLRPVNPSCFNEVGAARARVSEVADRAESVIGRLLGPWPTSCDTTVTNPNIQPGLMDQASADAQAICRLCESVMDALKRLEDSLP